MFKCDTYSLATQDLHGHWSVVDSGYPSFLAAADNGEHLVECGACHAFAVLRVVYNSREQDDCSLNLQEDSDDR